MITIEKLSLLDEALRLGAAFAIGLLLGIERGWTLRSEIPGSRVAGIRTFILIGLTGGVSGMVAAGGAFIAGYILLTAAASLLVVGYVSDLRRRPDATSALAALLALAVSFVAGLGNEGLAVAVGALAVLVLALRAELHGLIERLDQRDIKALARFSIIALAVFPFLPNRPLGPYGAWNPAKLWWVVVLVTGFSFAGYVANRLFGVRHGTIATALIGGAYSSTAVTLSLARRLASGSALGAETAGIALASAVMYLRILILVAVLATRMLMSLAVLVAPALVIAWVAGIWLFRSAANSDGHDPPGNPIEIIPAVGFLIFVASAALAARWAEGQFGQRGIAVLLLITGSMDVDSAVVTAGGLSPAAIEAPLGAFAIAGTIVINMLVKTAVTVAYGGRAGRKAAIALLASTVSLAATITVSWLL